MLDLWPWKLLPPKAPVNKPPVDWVNAVTRALSQSKFIVDPSITEPEILRANTNGSGWLWKIPAYKTSSSGRFRLYIEDGAVKIGDGRITRCGYLATHSDAEISGYIAANGNIEVAYPISSTLTVIGVMMPDGTQGDPDLGSGMNGALSMYAVDANSMIVPDGGTADHNGFWEIGTFETDRAGAPVVGSEVQYDDTDFDNQQIDADSDAWSGAYTTGLRNFFEHNALVAAEAFTGRSTLEKYDADSTSPLYGVHQLTNAHEVPDLSKSLPLFDADALHAFASGNQEASGSLSWFPLDGDFGSTLTTKNQKTLGTWLDATWIGAAGDPPAPEFIELYMAHACNQIAKWMPHLNVSRLDSAGEPIGDLTWLPVDSTYLDRTPFIQSIDMSGDVVTLLGFENAKLGKVPYSSDDLGSEKQLLWAWASTLDTSPDGELTVVTGLSDGGNGVVSIDEATATFTNGFVDYSTRTGYTQLDLCAIVNDCIVTGGVSCADIVWNVEGCDIPLAHTDLTDMPDTFGLNIDHDARYWLKGEAEDENYGSAIGNGTATVIDLTNALFNTAAGAVSVDADERQLSNGKEMTVDWMNRLLNLGSTSVVQWGNGYLNFPNGTGSMDWFECLLYDKSGLTAIDYNNRYGYDHTGLSAVLDWGNMLLSSTDYMSSIDWSDRILYDAEGNEALNYANRDFTGQWSFLEAFKVNGTLYGEVQISVLVPGQGQKTVKILGEVQ